MNVYTVRMPFVASGTAAKDLIRVSAPATAVLRVLRAWIGAKESEVSDQVAAAIQRASTDGTGTANTPVLHEASSPAFPGTAVHNLTADTTPGDVLLDDGWNILNGFLWVPTPEEQIVVPPSGRLVLRLSHGLDTDISITAGLVVGVVG